MKRKGRNKKLENEGERKKKTPKIDIEIGGRRIRHISCGTAGVEELSRVRPWLSPFLTRESHALGMDSTIKTSNKHTHVQAHRRRTTRGA